MTVLLGFSFPDLTVLGADGRGVAVHNPQDVAEGMQKIRKTGFGLMAGAGRTDLIDAVINRFANYAPSSNFETREIIRAEITKLGLAEDDPALARTCWLAAYLTHGAAGPQAQLALASRDDNYEFGHFPHNRVVILAPAGMALDVSRQFNADAQTKFDAEVRDAPSEQRLQRCASIVGEVVKGWRS